MQFLFLVVIIIGLGGLVIEVLNPHSFLDTAGAFMRVGILLITASVWFVLTKGRSFRIRGALFLLVLALCYAFYGLRSWCGDVYTEQSQLYEHVGEVEYSCPGIIFKKR